MIHNAASDTGEVADRHDVAMRSNLVGPTTRWNAAPEEKQYFQAIWNRLTEVDTANDAARVIGLTSSQPGEGVSTVAASLALAAAEVSHHDVLLVDANFGRPALAQWFGLPSSPGLAECLIRGGAPCDAIRETRVPRLKLAPAGKLPSSGAPTIERAQLATALDGFKQRFPWILIDLPCARQSSLALSWASLVDGLLLVVEAERVRRQVAQRARDLLMQSDGTILGVVLSKRRQHVPEWLYRTL